MIEARGWALQRIKAVIESIRNRASARSSPFPFMEIETSNLASQIGLPAMPVLSCSPTGSPFRVCPSTEVARVQSCRTLRPDARSLALVRCRERRFL